MSRKITMAALAALTWALAGCAGAPKSDSEAVARVDTERMAVVEQAAVRAGVRIHWVNPPTVRIK